MTSIGWQSVSWACSVNMEAFATHFVATLEQFHVWGYWVVALIALLEAVPFVGLFVPGMTIIIIVGFAIANGVWNMSVMWAFVAVGAVLGDVIGYFMGRHTEVVFQRHYRMLMRSRHMQRAQQFFRSHRSGYSVLAGRFIGPIRPIVPFVAGLLNMSALHFVVWSVVGSIIYATVFLALGYFFGSAWHLVVVWSTKIGFTLILAVVVMVMVVILYRWSVRRVHALLLLLHSLLASALQGIAQNEHVVRFRVRHPRLVAFFARRVDRRQFSGLTLTLLGGVFCYVVLLLAGAVEGFVTADPIASVDVRAEHLSAALRTPEGITFFTGVTFLGDKVIAGMVIVLVSALLVVWRRRDYILPLLVTFGGAAITTTLGKHFFDRPRPSLAVYAEHSQSFPSGHATTAMSLYGFIAYILIRHAHTWKQKVTLFFAAAILIGMIGLSRLYLGVHYVSDVWTGYLVGALWLLIGMSIVEWYHASGKIAVHVLLPWRKTLTLVLVGAISAGAFLYALGHVPQQRVVRSEPSEVVTTVDALLASERLRYTETLTGARQEPLSFVILAPDDATLIAAFRAAGWTLAEPVTLSTLYRTARTALFQQPYPTAPMTPSFWNMRVHDFGFQKETDLQSVRQRHHARFWRTGHETRDGLHIYIGTASFDKGIKWGVTHTIAPDVDTERDVIMRDLQRTGFVTSLELRQLVQPVLGANFSGDPFFTDGKAYIITLDTPLKQ